MSLNELHNFWISALYQEFVKLKNACPCLWLSYIIFHSFWYQSKTAQTRGKKSGNEGEVTCEEEDASTSEQNQNEKPSEDLSTQPDVHSQEHVSVFVVFIIVAFFLVVGTCDKV